MILLFVYPAASSVADSLNIPNSQERFDPVIVGHDLTIALIQVFLSKESHFIKSRTITYISGHLLFPRSLTHKSARE